VAEQLGQCWADASHTVLVADRAPHGVVGDATVHWFPNLMKGGDGYISELFLHPESRGLGVGALLAAIAREASARGITRLMLFNRRERESYARGFYQKHGWDERNDVAFFTYTLPKEAA
jgi:GNAT superfamily N-acetyltransferase